MPVLSLAAVAQGGLSAALGQTRDGALAMHLGLRAAFAPTEQLAPALPIRLALRVAQTAIQTQTGGGVLAGTSTLGAGGSTVISGGAAFAGEAFLSAAGRQLYSSALSAALALRVGAAPDIKPPVVNNVGPAYDPRFGPTYPAASSSAGVAAGLIAGFAAAVTSRLDLDTSPLGAGAVVVLARISRHVLSLTGAALVRTGLVPIAPPVRRVAVGLGGGPLTVVAMLDPDGFGVTPATLTLVAGARAPRVVATFLRESGAPLSLAAITLACRIRRHRATANVFTGAQSVATVTDALGGLAQYQLPAPLRGPATYTMQFLLTDSNGTQAETAPVTIAVVPGL